MLFNIRNLDDSKPEISDNSGKGYKRLEKCKIVPDRIALEVPKLIPGKILLKMKPFSPSLFL